MLSLIKLSMASLVTAVLLTACASPFKASSSQIYYEDGKVAYVASCKSVNSNWGDCLKAAGAICKEAGYTILEKSNPTYSYDADEKEMVFACNGNPPATESK